MDNLEEYDNPIEYDCEYGEKEPEFSFYLDLARNTGNPILEAACGTGRIALPLSREGFEVTGIDSSEPMLQWAKKKSKGTSLNLILADCQSFDLKRKFQLIYMTGNAFQALLTPEAQTNFLSKIKEHLLKDGTFAFDTRFPCHKELSESQKEEFWHSYINPKGQCVRVSGYQIYDPSKQIVEYTTFRRWKDEFFVEHLRKTKINLRFTFPTELKALLEDHGFRIEKIFGDWEGSKLTEESKKIICVCKLIEGFMLD